MGAKSSKEIDDLIREKGLNGDVNDLIEKNRAEIENKKNKKWNKNKLSADAHDGLGPNGSGLPPYSTMSNRLHASLRSTPPTYNGRNYTATVKSMPQNSRLAFDDENPTLMATLPPHLTSVVNTNRKKKATDPFDVQRDQQPQLDSSLIDSAWHNLTSKMPVNKPTKALMLEELLECPICMNPYDDPHVLPCQHTFCKGCIITLKGDKEDNRINCPICRELHVLANGIDSLPANYTMKRLIELEAMKPVEEEKVAEIVPSHQHHHKYHDPNSLSLEYDLANTDHFHYERRRHQNPHKPRGHHRPSRKCK
jgi:hypothetical protein